ncbi:hypothetical protein PRIPAC_73098, partial [Pristionchus pacificus]
LPPSYLFFERSLSGSKTEKDSFASILSIEKRLARDATTPVSEGDVSMGENGAARERGTTTFTSVGRPLTAMVEPVHADATVTICYPRERAASQSALMRACAFVFEKILLAEPLEDPSSSSCSNGSSAAGAKRRRALSDEARERADQSRGGAPMREGRASGEGASLVSATAPPTEPALYNWGMYALPARLWIGRRNVKRKALKEHAGKEEIEISRWSRSSCSTAATEERRRLPYPRRSAYPHRARRIRLPLGCDDDEIPSIGRRSARSDECRPLPRGKWTTREVRPFTATDVDGGEIRGSLFC